MSNTKSEEEREKLVQRLDEARAKLRATGATVLTPTVEWVALRKEIVELNRKLK